MNNDFLEIDAHITKREELFDKLIKHNFGINYFTYYVERFSFFPLTIHNSIHINVYYGDRQLIKKHKEFIESLNEPNLTYDFCYYPFEIGSHFDCEKLNVKNQKGEDYVIQFNENIIYFIYHLPLYIFTFF